MAIPPYIGAHLEKHYVKQANTPGLAEKSDDELLQIVDSTEAGSALHQAASQILSNRATAQVLQDRAKLLRNRSKERSDSD